MRKLFRNSFLSFLKNKTVVVLLSLILFLTTATFTTFNSASRAFEKSYNNVVSEGNLHDFTIKEKYDPEGSAISEPQATTDITFSNKVVIDKTSPSYFKGANGKDYIAVLNTAYKSTGWLSTDFTTPFLVEAKKLDSYLKDSSSTKTLEVNMIYKLEGGNVSKTTESMFESTGEKAAIQGFADDLTSKNPNGYINLSIKIDPANPFTQTFHGHEMKTDAGWISKFQTNAKKVMDKTFHIVDGEYTKYLISLNQIKSGKMYSSYDKQIPANERDEFYALKTQVAANTKVSSAGEHVIDWDSISAIDTKTFSSFDIKARTKALIKKINNGVETAQHQMTLDYLDKFKAKGQLEYKDVKSLYITDKGSSFRFIDEGKSNAPVDKLKIFSGWGLAAEEPWADQVKKVKEVVVKQGDAKHVSDVKDSDISKDGFRALWATDGLVPKNASHIDLSSYSAVVSPSYATANGKTALSKQEWTDITKKIQDIFDKNIGDTNASGSQDIKALFDGYKKNTVWVENTPYLVTGVGVSPDFSYPIIDASSPIPDENAQALLYTNSAGYARINQAFAGNPTENYVAVKMTSKAPAGLFNTINTYLTDAMSWPSNMQAARMVNDLNEKYLLAPQRITFLQKIRKTVSTISWTTTILLVVFTAFIVGLVIRKQISNRRKQLGILMANGYTRRQISFSMTSIGLIVASVSTILGYLVGHFMQFAFVSIFSDYWTLPIWETQFSWITFVVTVVVPILGVGTLAYIISYIELRGSLISILNGSASKTSSAVSNAIMRPFTWMGIKPKLSISIFASNISKMVMALTAFAATITVSTIAINSFGKFDTALTQSEKLSDYEYQIDLVNPTQESGSYGLLSLDDIVSPKTMQTKNAKLMYEHDGKNGMPTDKVKPYFHVPTKNDKGGQTGESKYLKNRIQMKSLLGPKMGKWGQGASGWDIAQKMMPENQKNMAEQKYIEFRNWSIDHFRSLGQANPFKGDGWFPKTGYNIDFTSSDIAGTNGFFSFTPHIKPSYLEFVETSLREVFKEYKTDRTVPIPYMISYGNIIANGDDETYTHVDTTITYNNFKSNKVTEKWMIRGIQDDSDRINLSDDSIAALKSFDTSTNITPIVVNKYFAKVHNVGIGDAISSNINNMANENKLTPSQKANQIHKFQIVGVEDSYDDGRTFTLQKYANKILGWKDTDHMFNGIYSKHKDELMFNTLSLYSQSGFYEAVNKLDHTDDTNKITQTMKTAVAKWAPTGNPLLVGKDDDETLTKFVATYGAVPYVLSYSNVDWAMATDYQFHSVMKLSSSIIWLIEGIAFFIATLFVALISTMIISDNKKFISTLKVLGYRTSEISRIFLRTFIPALIIAIIIGGLLASSIVLGIQSVLIGFGNVLIPFYITTWEIVAAAAILVIGFLITYFASSRELRNTSLLNAFKE